MKKSRSHLQYFSFAFALSLLLAAGLPAHAQLNILLTNADGFGEPGIEALKTRLREEGYTVYVGAPDGNASTSSASLDLTRPFYQVICPDVNNECRVLSVCVEGVTPPATCTTLEYLGPATPAASVAATIAALGKDPADFDVIISGINDGTNLGPRAPFSGTVGGVIAAISKNAADVPGIAVSTAEDPINATVDDVADFVATLVAQLEDARKDPSDKLLPDGVGLSINYPDLAPHDVAGVELTVQGRLDRDFETGELFVTRAVPFPPLADANVFVPETTTIPSDDTEVPGADTTMFNAGYITITPIEADYTASKKARKEVAKLLKELL